MSLPATSLYSAPTLSPGRWSPGVREGLQALIPAHGIHSERYDPERPPVAAFDFDDTCIAGDISHALLDDLERSRPGQVRHYQEACARDLKAAYVELVGTLVAGQTEAEVQRATQEALERALADGRIRWVREMGELLAWLQAHGWQTWIVTASPTPVVAVLADHYGIPAERVLGMCPIPDDSGRYTAQVSEPVTYRSGKRQALHAAIGRDALLAAGDSASDGDLMRNAQHALLIDRGDPAMREEGLRRGWWIQEAWR